MQTRFSSSFNLSTSGNILIKDGIIVASGLSEPVKSSVLVENGLIKSVTSAPPDILPPDTHVINADGMFVMPGLIDVHVHFREPGNTNAEDFQSGSKSALAGGFTTVCVMPNTNPPPDSASSVLSVYNRIADSALNRVLVIASATLERSGKTGVNVEKCLKAGAVAFSDDGDAIENEEILRNLLIKSKQYNFPVTDHCEIVKLSKKNPVNSGKISEKLNISGQPSSSETVQLAKGIMLSAETGGHYHAQHLSSADSVKLVDFAKRSGFNVTSEVTVHHLVLNENDVLSKGTYAKCAPPLRTEHDRQALIEALRSGIIDIVVTDHAPHVKSSKETGLNKAAFGVIGLETALPLMYSFVEQQILSLKDIVKLMSEKPAEIFGFERVGRILPDYAGDLVVFDPRETYEIPSSFYSKSSNSPFIGMTVKGMVKYTIFAGNLAYAHR